jgi:predicted aspartyl protease
MRALVALACAASVTAVPAPAQDTGLSVSGECAVVPMLPAAIPVIEVKIGGKGPYRFAVDTGAEGHGRISAALAEELGLPKVGKVDATAGAAASSVFGAPEISVGGVSFKNPDLVAMSDSPGQWDGVIGNALLALLPVTLDHGAARVRFGGPELSEGLPIGFDHGVPVLPIEIAGKRFKVHFDSGNGAAALFLDEEAARALPLAGEPARTGSGDVAAMEAPLAVPVSAGTVRLPVQAVGWPSPRAGGSLGSRAMAGIVVTIDPASQLANVAYSAAPPRCPR